MEPAIYSENKVSFSRTQHNVPGQPASRARTLTARSGGEIASEQAHQTSSCRIALFLAARSCDSKVSLLAG